jgi:nucleotide-binding universal stress UspA family protein
MERIVVGVDGSAAADRALRWAVREARLRAAEVEVVHCFVAHGAGAVARAQQHQHAQARLEAVTARNRVDLDEVTWHGAVVPVVAVPSTGLIAAAADADLLVVGARGAEGFQRLRLGSTGFRSAARATVPVAVISADGGAAAEAEDVHRALVVGVDDSAPARRALRWALAEATRRAVPVTVAHAYQPAGPDDAARAEAAAQGLLRTMDVDGSAVPVTAVAARGTPASVLLELTCSDHVLVVGARGAGPESDLPFGSVSHQCLHHACGPTVIVP